MMANSVRTFLAGCWEDAKARAAYRTSGPRIAWKTEANVNRDVRVSYGLRAMPTPGECTGGGIVKLLDLARLFPDCRTDANILYLVSSSLPPYAPALVREAKKAGANVILNQNGVAYPAWDGPAYDVTNRPLRKVLEQADHVFYQSAFCKLSADRYLGPAKNGCEILHNAVDTSIFHPRPVPRTSNSIMLLVAGSHCLFYRIESALKTLALLRAEGVEARLMIAGRFAWRPRADEAQRELDTAARELKVAPWVEVVGPYSQTEAVNLFQRADILLHTQVNDSCPRLVLEAMACGVPVVYSASGGTPELVGDAAGRGISTPLDWEHLRLPEATDLAKAVLAVMADHQAYAQGARKLAVTRFDVKPWCDRHRHVFSRLATSS